LRQHVFAGAGLAREENGCLDGGELPDLSNDATHGARAGDDARPGLRAGVFHRVVEARGRAAGHDRATHDEAGSGRELGAMNAPTADENPVSRSEVLDEQAPPLGPDSAMPLAHGAIVDSDIDVLPRSEHQRFPIAEQALPRRARAADLDEPGL